MATINHKTYNEATETFKDFNVYDGKETLIFKVDGSEGNVGIGTSSPTDTIGYGRALDIQSSAGAVVYLRDSNAPTTQYGFLAFDGTDNGLKLHNANSSGFLRFDTNATEKMRITSAGNVGINTSAPTNLLHLAGASATPSLRLGSVSAGFYWDIGRENATTGDFVFNNASGGASTERMRITAAGNVGIGTSSPTATLDVGGEIKLSSDLYMGNDRFLRFERNSGSTSIQTLGIPTGTDDVRLLTTGDFNLVTGSLSNLLTVKQAGNVGIGTDAPDRKLTVHSAASSVIADFKYTAGGFSSIILSNTTGSASIASISNDLVISPAGTERMRISNAGNVGIGTSAPSQKLHVAGGNLLVNNGASPDSNSGIRIVAPISTTHYNWLIGAQDNINNGFEITPSTAVGGTTFNSPALSISATSGNVGIGTSSPASRLHVQNGALQVSGNSIDTIVSYSTVGIVGTATAHDLQIVRNGAEICRVTANGLTFNGDTAAANALDDYEEGTFTATLSPSDSGSISLSAATCTYTKIGRQVVVKGLIAISSVSTPVGASVTIGGLPFTIINSTAGRGSFSVVILDASASYTAATYPTQHTLNATSLIVYVNASTIEPNDEIMFTATYFV